jgi:CheY-like chemotaxis protein
MALILVVSPDWRTRALLAAQLCETCGCDTVSAPGSDEALSLLNIMGVRPVLVVIDTGGVQGEIGKTEIEHLLTALSDTPALLIGSAFQRLILERLKTQHVTCLIRPVSIGMIAETARRLLGGMAPTQT